MAPRPVVTEWRFRDGAPVKPEEIWCGHCCKGRHFYMPRKPDIGLCDNCRDKRPDAQQLCDKHEEERQFKHGVVEGMSNVLPYRPKESPKEPPKQEKRKKEPKAKEPPKEPPPKDEKQEPANEEEPQQPPKADDADKWELTDETVECSVCRQEEPYYARLNGKPQYKLSVHTSRRTLQQCTGSGQTVKPAKEKRREWNAAGEAKAPEEPPQLTVQTGREVLAAARWPDTVFGGRLIRGVFTPIVGAGDVGKGYLASDLIARLTNGDPFPGEDGAREPMVVIICTTEDSKSIVSMRLNAAGADIDNIRFVTGPTVLMGGLEVPSQLKMGSDASALVKLSREWKAGAVWMETLLAHMGDREGRLRIDSNSELGIRTEMSKISLVMEAANLIGFGALHPRKSLEGSVEDSISGSKAFSNISRIVMHVFIDPVDKSNNPMRLLACSKSNYLARKPLTMRFGIESWEEDDRLGRVKWPMALIDPRRVEDIWLQFKKKAEENKPRRDKRVEAAEKLLTRLLSNGREMSPTEVMKWAKTEGISEDSLTKAKGNLGVESVRENEWQAHVKAWKLPGLPDV